MSAALGEVGGEGLSTVVSPTALGVAPWGYSGAAGVAAASDGLFGGTRIGAPSGPRRIFPGLSVDGGGRKHSLFWSAAPCATVLKAHTPGRTADS